MEVTPMRSACFRRVILPTLVLSCGFIAALASCKPQQRETVNVAVAANFTEAAKDLAQVFQQKTGNPIEPSFGSTGQLLTQIIQDAPFDAFLSADQESPRKAVAAGFGVKESLFTYAVGKLVLYSGNLDLANGEDALRGGRFQKIAIANPTTAPYGAAAIETMKALGVYEQLSGKIVQGSNITQAFQFVETGNAEVGFVAMSQVLGKDARSIWIVPDNLYSPIRQDAVLLKRGAAKETAHAFMSFLRSAEAVHIIEKYGYRTAP
jgi:molybdate transport system substrate-binding protein